MTPGVQQVKRAGVAHTVHEYDHDPSSAAYGREAAQKLGLPEGRVFKTLVVSLDGAGLAVAVVPVSSMLNMKGIARAAGAKKAAMADKALVERTTGYVLGGVSPLGQRRRLTTYIDDSAQGFPTMFVSAGRRGLQIELSPRDLARLTQARFFPLCQ
ncbi:Cys-tRNA(Pro) deacylase [Ectothiorhodospira lacustris]|uniref:Cys-tRNA(Pro) deacylase n=1 Tax=Ectothiorhodospira lacustris TaxID=2899127 RepID=UPI001EE912BC|nr:Cys-tRNA(Pro) deacylase [Ectothiorhodospira lacustris]MCG5500827.1 Cys-tRNA(Pro) deacylase [Ectothiorhodospira lacustris]MCG5510608.1 Cys-tRNA(Pro) deacylase [Ectothiorhodospira lacustris]MCG5521300.1 Cys-tRNA(Pro) deacylase [Ectothiorhodospira lacustris]